MEDATSDIDAVVSPIAPSEPTEAKAGRPKTCDQCRRRKIKCDGGAPCSRCSGASLECSRIDRLRRRGPKAWPHGSLRRSRDQTSQHSLISGHASPQHSPENGDSSRGENLPARVGNGIDMTGPGSMATSSHSPLLSSGLSTHSADSIPAENTLNRRPLARTNSSLDFVPLCDITLSDPPPHPNEVKAVPDCGADIQPQIRPSLLSKYTPRGTDQVAAGLNMSPFAISQYLERYLSQLQPVLPVVDPEIATGMLARALSPCEEAMFVSMCAFTLLRCPGVVEESAEFRKSSAQAMMKRCQQLRVGFTWLSQPDMKNAVTSFLLSQCFFDLQHLGAQMHYLREAIFMTQDLYENHQNFQFSEPEQRNLYCLKTLLYITEVSLAVQRYQTRPLYTSEEPWMEIPGTLDGSILAGIRTLHVAFQVLRNTVLECLNHQNGSIGHDCENRICLAQERLSTACQGSYHALQRADVQITVLWARLILWNASLKHGFVSSSASDPAFQYDFPLTIARTLCMEMRDFSLGTIQIHGLGIHEKIFDIANALLDLTSINHQPLFENVEFQFLYHFLSESTASRTVHIPILDMKIMESGLGNTGS